MDRAGLLAFALQAVDELLARGDVVADSLAGAVAELRAVKATDVLGGRSLDVSEVTANLAHLFVSVSESAPAIAELMDSGMFRSDVMALLAEAAEAAVEAKRAVDGGALRVQGPLSLVKSLRDQDVQRGLSYVIEMAAALGRKV